MAATGTAGRSDMVEACDRCGTEFLVDSRFCHTCGAGRAGLHTTPLSRLKEQIVQAGLLDLGETLGLTAAPLLAFAVGVICLIAALGVGLIFNARTLTDWQAVQLWRIEWLLAAVAAFVAGCLLKKPSKS